MQKMLWILISCSASKVPSASNWDLFLTVDVVPALVPVAPKPGFNAWGLQSVLQKTKSQRFIADVSNLSLCLSFSWDHWTGSTHCTLHWWEGLMEWCYTYCLLYLTIWIFIENSFDWWYVQCSRMASLKSTAASWREGILEYLSVLFLHLLPNKYLICIAYVD